MNQYQIDDETNEVNEVRVNEMEIIDEVQANEIDEIASLY
jgi:hypothetical protein